jgi:IS30 family transposase
MPESTVAPHTERRGGHHLAVHTPGHLRAVEDELNRRPRIVLDDRAPADLFNELLASLTGQVLRR